MATYKMQNGRRSASSKKRELSYDESLNREILMVAMHFSQYNIDQLAKFPRKLLDEMYLAIQRERAETLLYLNVIVNGPNEKSKTKKNYKSTIEALVKFLD